MADSSAKSVRDERGEMRLWTVCFCHNFVLVLISHLKTIFLLVLIGRWPLGTL